MAPVPSPINLSVPGPPSSRPGSRFSSSRIRPLGPLSIHGILVCLALLVSLLTTTVLADTPVVNVRAAKPVSTSLDSSDASSSSLSDTSSSASLPSGVVSVDIQNHGLAFFLDAYISDQKQTFLLDTANGDTWVYDSSILLCADTSTYFDGISNNINTSCAANTPFNTSQSSSIEFLNQDFNLTYLDNSTVTGVIVSDNFNLSSSIGLSNMVFGLANKSYYNYARLGIGMKTSGLDNNQSLLDKLYEQGLIGSRTYSLFFDDAEQSTGQILFGGIMPNKFEGNLYTLDTSPLAGEATPSKFFVTLTGASVFSLSNGKSANLSTTQVFEPVLLDSTSILTYLPQEIALNLAIQLNALYFDEIEAWVQSCSYQNLNGSLNFHFGEAEFKVPISDLFYPITNARGEQLTFASGTAACILAVSSSDYLGYSSLGLSFLRNMYTYFDADNLQVSLAQASFNSTQGTSYAVNNDSLPDILGSKHVNVDQAYIPTVTVTDGNSTLFRAVKNNMFTTGVVITNGELISEYNINTLDASVRLASTRSSKTTGSLSANAQVSLETIKTTETSTHILSGTTQVFTMTLNLSTRTVVPGVSATTTGSTADNVGVNANPQHSSACGDKRYDTPLVLLSVILSMLIVVISVVV